MSEIMDITFEKKGNHIKGKSLISKPYLISCNNENIFNSNNITKTIRNDSTKKSNLDFKMSVKTTNNKSFMLRPKNKKVNLENVNKIISKNLKYNIGNSFIDDEKKTSKIKNNKINGKNSNNPFHTRIRSF